MIGKCFRFSLYTLCFSIGIIGIVSCTATRKNSGHVRHIIADSLLRGAHLGLCIFDPERQQYLVDYQSEHYFIPASNTKILTCYTGMKYLGDSLPAAYISETDSALFVFPTGDPSFLHRDFPYQPLAKRIRSSVKPVYGVEADWHTKALGRGWSWDDYSESYMAERSPMPIYGNQIRWYQTKSRKDNPAYAGDTTDLFISSEPEIDWPVSFGLPGPEFSVSRSLDQNAFTITEGREKEAWVDVPFLTGNPETTTTLIRDTLHVGMQWTDGKPGITQRIRRNAVLLRSQATDTMLRYMMYRSDNFLAEQTLQMVSNQLLNRFDEAGLISKLLGGDLMQMPQRPSWVDGSGLSRYNLITPRDLVWILDQMRREFGMTRLKNIFPHPGGGTLASFREPGADQLFAKTGTMTGVVALSGYLYGRSGKLLIFSFLVNHHRSNAPAIRKQMASLLKKIADQY